MEALQVKTSGTQSSHQLKMHLNNEAFESFLSDTFLQLKNTVVAA